MKGFLPVILLSLAVTTSSAPSSPKIEAICDGIPARLEPKFEKDFPHCKPWPVDLSKAKVRVDPPPKSKRTESFWKQGFGEKEVKSVLSNYHVVTEREWRNVSHVALNDRTGWITLSDGNMVRWLIRPAGIARIVYLDGGTVYLLECCEASPCS